MEKNRATFNLRRRNARKGLCDVEKEPEVKATVVRPEVAQDSKQAKISELRGLITAEEEKPATVETEIVETRSAKDVVGGIYRNDSGGVISKFAWDKLQRMKEHAKKNNFEIDEYSQ
jgi:hypothetical protein